MSSLSPTFPSLAKDNNNSKPSKDIMNFFDKKTYLHVLPETMNLNASTDQKNAQVSSEDLMEFKITEEGGPIQDPEMMPYNSESSNEYYFDKFDGETKRKKKQQQYRDQNILNAIELRNNKSKHSDYYFRLVELKEKIDLYNFIFKNKEPKFLFPTKVKQILRTTTPDEEKMKRELEAKKEKKKKLNSKSPLKSSLRKPRMSKFLKVSINQESDLLNFKQGSALKKSFKGQRLTEDQKQNKTIATLELSNQGHDNTALETIDEGQDPINESQFLNTNKSVDNVAQRSRNLFNRSASQKFNKKKNSKQEKLNKMIIQTQDPIMTDRQSRMKESNQKSIERAIFKDKKYSELQTQREKEFDIKMPSISDSSFSMLVSSHSTQNILKNQLQKQNAPLQQFINTNYPQNQSKFLIPSTYRKNNPPEIADGNSLNNNNLFNIRKAVNDSDKSNGFVQSRSSLNIYGKLNYFKSMKNSKDQTPEPSSTLPELNQEKGFEVDYLMNQRQSKLNKYENQAIKRENQAQIGDTVSPSRQSSILQKSQEMSKMQQILFIYNAAKPRELIQKDKIKVKKLKLKKIHQKTNLNEDIQERSHQMKQQQVESEIKEVKE